MDLSRMNQIQRVSADDLDCTVQAGVTRQQLDEYLRPCRMFFPADPSADATIGGMASTVFPTPGLPTIVVATWPVALLRNAAPSRTSW